MQYIIDFKNDTSIDLINAYLKKNHCTIVTVFSTMEQTYLVTSNAVPPKSDIVEHVIDNEANPINLLGDFTTVEFETADEENWWKLASFTKPNLDASTQSYERRGDAATIYLMDSGVKLDHDEFISAKVSNLFSFNNDMNDYAGHGTALASVMVGNTTGVAEANVKSVKIFQAGVATLQSDILAALNAIIDDFMLNPKQVAIVNMSWGIPKNTFLESKIQVMIDAGITVVAAAGNSGVAIEDVTPASMADVMTVGAYDHDFLPCNFSNYTGDLSTTPNVVNMGALDVWAPGANIKAAGLHTNYITASGTSFAAAIYSAAVAYNAHTYILEDGNAAVKFKGHSTLTTLSTGRTGLLHLSGPYAASVNAIATFRGEYYGDNDLKYNLSSKFTSHAYSGKPMAKLAAPFFVIKDFVIKKPLPDGVTMNNGWLVGTIGTLQDTESFMWTSDVTYTTHDGMQRDAVMTIGVIPSGIPKEEIPTDDPALKISLFYCSELYNAGNQTYYCDGSCLEHYCHDVCAGGSSKQPGVILCECNIVECP